MSRFFEDLEQQLHAAAAQQAAAPPTRWWRRRRNLAILAVLTVGIATPAVSRVTGVWDPHVAQAPPPTVVTVPAASVRTCHDPERATVVPADAHLDPRFVAQLAVLRRPRRPADIVPTLGRGHFTVIAKSVRYVGSIGGRRFYLAGVVSQALRRCGEPPRRTRPTQLCLMELSGSGGCGLRPIDLRTTGMSGTSLIAAGRSSFTSVVPDGVVRASVRYGTSVRSFAVHDNFFGYEVAVPPTRFPDVITWTMRDGTRRVLPHGG